MTYVSQIFPYYSRIEGFKVKQVTFITIILHKNKRYLHQYIVPNINLDNETTYRQKYKDELLEIVNSCQRKNGHVFNSYNIFNDSDKNDYKQITDQIFLQGFQNFDYNKLSQISQFILDYGVFYHRRTNKKNIFKKQKILKYGSVFTEKISAPLSEIEKEFSILKAVVDHGLSTLESSTKIEKIYLSNAFNKDQENFRQKRIEQEQIALNKKVIDIWNGDLMPNIYSDPYNHEILEKAYKSFDENLNLGLKEISSKIQSSYQPTSVLVEKQKETINLRDIQQMTNSELKSAYYPTYLKIKENDKAVFYHKDFTTQDEFIEKYNSHSEDETRDLGGYPYRNTALDPWISYETFYPVLCWYIADSIEKQQPIFRCSLSTCKKYYFKLATSEKPPRRDSKYCSPNCRKKNNRIERKKR